MGNVISCRCARRFGCSLAGRRPRGSAPIVPTFASRGPPWHPGAMARETTEEVLTQLATRIPKDLHRRLKLYCVTNDIALMHFVVEAIEEKLGRKTGRKKGT